MSRHPCIAVVVEGHDSDSFPAVQRYVEQHDLDWHLIRIDIDTRSLPALIASGTYAGWIGFFREPPELPRQATQLPAAVLKAGPARPGLVRLQYDLAAAGRLAAEHFVSRGFKAVAIVHPPDNPGRAVSYGAFLSEAERRGLTALAPAVPPHKRQRLPALLEWLTTEAPRPLGVFVHQDRDAFDLLTTCQVHRIAVPQRLAVLGVDDLPSCRSTDPPLSSITFNRMAIASDLAHHLHRLLAGASSGDEVFDVPPLRVMTRASTAYLASGDAKVDAVRRRVLKNPGGRHDMARLARAVRLSPCQLHRRFRAACDQTPGQWLAACRLDLAQDLLLHGQTDTRTVARRCGLHSRAGLWNLFDAAGLPAPTVWLAHELGEHAVPPPS